MGGHYAHIGIEGEGERVNGNAVWKMKWRRVEGERANLPHPGHIRELHDYDVYEVEDEKGRVTQFAAAELSASVRGFCEWREG